MGTAQALETPIRPGGSVYFESCCSNSTSDVQSGLSIQVEEGSKIADAGLRVVGLIPA